MTVAMVSPFFIDLSFLFWFWAFTISFGKFLPALQNYRIVADAAVHS